MSIFVGCPMNPIDAFMVDALANQPALRGIPINTVRTVLIATLIELARRDGAPLDIGHSLELRCRVVSKPD